ncbi:hypothetical protein ACFONC_07395 [Luteimonas soli]
MARKVFEDVKAQEEKLGLPDGFYMALYKEDDWSFVIKLNALVEAACTHSLVARLHAQELSGALAALDLGNSKFGKVALLRSLGSLTSEQASVLKLLYELRNSLAHNITQVSFSFAPYLDALDKNQRASFVKYAGHGVDEIVSHTGKAISRSDFVLENPKFALWMTVAEIIACLYLDHEIAEARLQRLALGQLKGGRA